MKSTFIESTATFVDLQHQISDTMRNTIINIRMNIIAYLADHSSLYLEDQGKYVFISDPTGRLARLQEIVGGFDVGDLATDKTFNVLETLEKLKNFKKENLSLEFEEYLSNKGVKTTETLSLYDLYTPMSFVSDPSYIDTPGPRVFLDPTHPLTRESIIYLANILSDISAEKKNFPPPKEKLDKLVRKSIHELQNILNLRDLSTSMETVWSLNADTNDEPELYVKATKYFWETTLTLGKELVENGFTDDIYAKLENMINQFNIANVFANDEFTKLSSALPNATAKQMKDIWSNKFSPWFENIYGALMRNKDLTTELLAAELKISADTSMLKAEIEPKKSQTVTTGLFKPITRYPASKESKNLNNNTPNI